MISASVPSGQLFQTKRIEETRNSFFDRQHTFQSMPSILDLIKTQQYTLFFGFNLKIICFYILFRVNMLIGLLR